jgi:hypothetical protein
MKCFEKDRNVVYLHTQKMEIVAQLVRALVCGAGGRGFETHQSPKILEIVGF